MLPWHSPWAGWAGEIRCQLLMMKSLRQKRRILRGLLGLSVTISQLGLEVQISNPSLALVKKPVITNFSSPCSCLIIGCFSIERQFFEPDFPNSFVMLCCVFIHGSLTSTSWQQILILCFLCSHHYFKNFVGRCQVATIWWSKKLVSDWVNITRGCA